MSFWCYIIKNIEEKYINNSYCGFTTNPLKRLRQHNREIKGGAKATNKGKWDFLFLITGFETKNKALSCEWKLKHPDKKRRKSKIYRGLDGRIKSIQKILESEIIDNKEYLVFIHEKIHNKLDASKIPKNIFFIIIDNDDELKDIFKNI
jgi:predicted GIY-YIG superfamily endonuclease